MDVHKDDLDRIENELIDYYQPEYNKTINKTRDAIKHERQRR